MHIPELDNLNKALRTREIEILNRPYANEVKKLSELSKQLSQAIAELMESEASRSGVEGEFVRSNESILSGLIHVIEDPGSKWRLGRTKETLTKLNKERNSGAHACPKGSLRETEPADYPELESQFDEFLQTLLEVAIGQRARRGPIPSGGTAAA